MLPDGRVVFVPLSPHRALPPRRLAVFGGELEAKDAARVLAAHAGGRWAATAPTLLRVNCRSNQQRVERCVVEQHPP